MNDLATTSIKSMPTKELRAKLVQALTLTAKSLHELGKIWVELESRGEDLNDLRVGISKMIPLIGRGVLAAEAVVAFAGREFVLKYLEGMDLDEQRKYADGQLIPVYIPGESECHAMPLSRIPNNSLKYLFGDGVVRTPLEQRMAMRNKKPKVRKDKRYTLKVDRIEREIKIGNTVSSIGAIITALSDACSPVEVTESTERPAKIIAGKVTDEEKERVQAAAKAHGITEGELVRRAVLAMWLL